MAGNQSLSSGRNNENDKEIKETKETIMIKENNI